MSVYIGVAMPNDDQCFAIDEPCALVDLPRRTVRYYVQEGLVDQPVGAKPSAPGPRGPRAPSPRLRGRGARQRGEGRPTGSRYDTPSHDQDAMRQPRDSHNRALSATAAARST